MILKITQEHRGTFLSVLENGRPKFYLAAQLPFKHYALDAHRNVMVDVQGGHLNSLLNSLPLATPIRWLIGSEIRRNKYDIDPGAGEMYVASKSPTKNRLVINHGHHQLDCYKIGRGITEHVVVHQHGLQVAETLRTLTSGGGTWGYIYLKPEYEALAPLVAIAMRIDFSSGMVVRGTRFKGTGQNAVAISTIKTKGGYSSLYDPQWVAQNFSPEAVAEVNQDITHNRTQAEAGVRIF